MDWPTLLDAITAVIDVKEERNSFSVDPLNSGTHYGSTCGHLNYFRKTTLQNIPDGSQWTGEGFTMGLRFHYNIILKLGKFKAPFVAMSMEIR